MMAFARIIAILLTVFAIVVKADTFEKKLPYDDDGPRSNNKVVTRWKTTGNSEMVSLEEDQGGAADMTFTDHNKIKTCKGSA